jgi:hypothetical protein
LERLFAAVGPFVAEADATAPPGVESVTARVTEGDPVVVDVRCHLADGSSRVFQATAGGAVGDALARAFGDLLVAGLDLLPADRRARIAAEKADGAVLAVVLDPQLSTAIGLVVSNGAERALFTLMPADSHVH